MEGLKGNILGYIEDLRKIVGHKPLILVGSVVVIIDSQGRILLQQRKFPHKSWGIPGGLMELGESTEDVAKREIFEETGLTINDLTLINVYSGPQNYVVAENGDSFYTVTTAYFTASYAGEMLIDKTESIQFKYYYPNQIPENVVESHKVILHDFLAAKKV
ncbi:NUDIX hydrolase [Virgibacillus sp. DJP39]|uniref:NUDIX hydrolase n=1 Tax=Virgibacillus sp. DJP39 TaxID=3409790 RepID=UPI003BB62B90